MGKLALILSAGGARGAYEAGVLHYIRKSLPPSVSQTNFPIQTGTSVGAINTVGWAAMAHDPKAQGERVRELWLSLGQENIYRRDFSAVWNFLQSTLRGILGNLVTFDPFKFVHKKGPGFYSLLDTTPLALYLKKTIAWKQVAQNVRQGPLDCIAISVTNSQTGNVELFLDKKSEVKYTGKFQFHEGTIKLEHIMASSAIPLIFPSIKIKRDYYMDGGLRLSTPISPAIHLGADRLLIIGLRHHRDKNERGKDPHRIYGGRPTLGQQMGRMLNGVFLDHLEYDIAHLEKVNWILDMGEREFGKKFLTVLRRDQNDVKRKDQREQNPLKKIRFVEILPSEYISKIFHRWVDKIQRKKFKFTSFEKFMIRILDIDPRSGVDLLSYLTFAPKYLNELFELGYQDAHRSRQSLKELLED